MMAAVLVVAADELRRTRLRRVLTGHSIVLTAANDAEALRIARYVDLDIVVRDAPESARGLPELADGLRQAAPRALLIVAGVVSEDLEVEATLPTAFTERDVETALTRALEKQRLFREMATMRSRTTTPTPGPVAEVGWDSEAVARALKCLARALAAGLDLSRLLEAFLEAVVELSRPSRVALLLPDPGDVSFRIAAHRGVPAPLVGSVHLQADGSLLRWLRVQGRPARLPELEADVARELSLLHSVVAVPLLAVGELIGVLALGQPLVRFGYATHEIETLFDLGSELAAAVRDILRQRELGRQKDIGDSILAHLASGIITIGHDHRVSTMNRRAEQILGLPAHDVLGEDLRILPSPLGDMLYETLTSGCGLSPSELQLALNRRWLEVSTHPVPGEGVPPQGAVLVFRDLTAQKAQAAVQQREEQREVLTRVVARIADEILNPLVSINTFTELIDERYHDADFRRDFSTVVRRDAGRLVEVLDKLRGLVEGGELNFSIVDIRQLLEDFIPTMRSGQQVAIELAADATQHLVKVDPEHLRRAISHLVGYLAHASGAEAGRVTLSLGRGTEPDAPDGVRLLITSRTARVPANTLGHLLDPVQMMQESLVAVGPAVSQRIIQSLGGQLRVRQGRHEIGFLIVLPPAE